MNDLTRRIAELPPAKRELLLQRLAEKHRVAPELPALVPDPARAEEPFPLTFVQQAYWAGRSGYFDMGACGTNFFLEFLVSGGGPAFLERFQAAVRRLIARHDSLRTVLIDGEQQRTLADPAWTLPVIDLRDLPPAAAAARLDADRERMKYAKHDLYTWPLFAFAAYLLADRSIRILTRIEALILDGTSNSLLLKELFTLVEDPEADLPPLSCSFRDYALALAALRGTDRFERARRYWQERIQSLPPAPAFPLVTCPTPLVESRPISRAAIVLPAAAWAQLRARAARCGLTPSAVVLTALTDAIAAWAAAPQFTISLVASYRLPFHPDISRMVGNFNSITLLAVDAGSGTFQERARRLQAQVTADLEQMYYPGFLVLQDWNRIRGGGTDCASPVLANSLIEYSHAAYASRQLDRDGVATSDGRIDLADMAFTIPQITFEPIFGVEPDGALSAQWVSLDALYPPGMFDAMFAHFQRSLAALAAGDDAWEGVAPADDLVGEMTALWEQVLERRPIAFDASLFSLGCTSLEAIRLIVAVERRFAVQLPTSILRTDPTMRGFVAVVRHGREGCGFQSRA